MLGAGALAATWWFVALAPVVAIEVLVVDSSAFDGPVDTVLFLVFGIPQIAALLAVGVWIGKALRRRVDQRARRLAGGLLGGCLAAGLVGAAYNADRPARDRTPEQPLVFDWKQGRYEGVRLGDNTATLIRVVGRPEKRGRDEPGQPVGEEVDRLTNYGSPDIGRRVADFETLRYKRRVFSTTGGRVTDWGTTDQRAQTPEGIGVGDSQELVKRRYRRADCFMQNEGTEYESYPICRIQICKGRLLGFGGDPINSLWLAAETKLGLRTCQRP